MPSKILIVDENEIRKIIGIYLENEGSGLGLAISKKIVELHHEQIWGECHGDLITINICLPIR